MFFIFLVGCVQQTPAQSGQQLNVNVSIDYGGLRQNDFFSQISVTNGSTALEAFSKVANLSTKTFSFGLYVNGINGVMEDSQAGKYWQYYVDGTLASVGADAFKIDKPMEFEFRLETPPEEMT